MIYNDYQNLKLSALGVGAMRLPVCDGNDANIDFEATEKMIAYAMEHGVNYYDTAWGYHGGNSEKVLGKILKKYPRDSFYLSTKFPGYDLSNMDKVEEIFEEQLKRCQTDYFDFYFFHNVNEGNIDAYLDKKYGIFEYLKKQKDTGRIRHLGFSAHGKLSIVQRFLEAYGEYMEFGMLQLNYLDWTFQQGKEKVDLLNKYNIPVWVMEPLRGGKLAKLPEELAAKLTDLRPEESVPAWAFRFTQSLPTVKMTLSGMSNMEQLQENIKTYEESKTLNQKEMETLLGVAQEMLSRKILPCTACKYCLTYCEQELDIPGLLELYNEHIFNDGGFLAPMAISAMPEEKRPSACVGCKSCEEVCPQQISIAEAMADFVEKLK